jgi:cytochrome P450
LIKLTISSNTLLYTFYLLAMHPKIQNKLYQEIHEICGNQTPQLADIPNLIYTLCVMYESMRICPVVGSTPQIVVATQMLGGHEIRKETRISSDLVALHRNEKYWGPTCEVFDPSRFDARIADDHDSYMVVDGKIKIPVKGAFLPFGEGPRICIGKHCCRIWLIH